MINYFRNILSSDNDQDPGFISLVRTVLTVSIVALTAISIVLALSIQSGGSWVSVGVVFSIIILSSVALFLNYRHILWPGKVLLPLAILVSVTFLTINSDGLNDSAIVGFTMVIIFTSLLVGQKAIPLATILTLLGVWTVAYADYAGISRFSFGQKPVVDEIVVISVIQIAAAAALNGLMSRLNSTLEKSRANELAQIKANQELRDLQTALEQRVAERTHSLELAAEVGRAVSEVRSLDVMLTEAAEIIRSRFDLYYTQVYLVNANQTELVLQAGTGKVGVELIRRSHRLPLNSTSINGRAAVEGHSVVIADTAASATFRPNPLLPETRSEMAVPLRVGERVIGVLDLQSRESGALNMDLLSAFEALAGQLAVAIQNANLLEEANQARAEVETQSRRMVRATWEDYLDAIHKPEHNGFVFEGNKISTFSESQPVGEGAALTVPITISGESLGTIVVEGEMGNLSVQNTALVQIVARQVAQQIENQRLLESSERYRLEAEQASRRLTREGWLEYKETLADDNLGYWYDLNEVKPASFENIIFEEDVAVTLPLKVRGETVGKLAILGMESGDSEALTLANAVAERLGSHVDSLRQHDQTQAALAQSEKLFEASRRLTMATDLQELVKSTVESLNLTEVNRAVLGTFRYGAAGELESMTIAANWWNGTGTEVEVVGKTYAAEALQRLPFLMTTQPIFLNDALKDERIDPASTQAAKELNIRALSVLPLLLGTYQLGILMLIAEESHNFTQDETRLFSALAPQIATVLENRRQFERAQHQAKRESTLNVISQKIQAATSVEAVLQIAARELGHALGAPRTIAQLSIKDKI